MQIVDGVVVVVWKLEHELPHIRLHRVNVHLSPQLRNRVHFQKFSIRNKFVSRNELSVTSPCFWTQLIASSLFAKSSTKFPFPLDVISGSSWNFIFVLMNFLKSSVEVFLPAFETESVKCMRSGACFNKLINSSTEK